MHNKVRIWRTPGQIDGRVLQGHCDLVGQDDRVIHPEFWERLVQPGLRLHLQLWPCPAQLEIENLITSVSDNISPALNAR